MATDRKVRLGTRRVPNARFIMVSIGIALFIIGFLVTVSFFSQTNLGRSQDESGWPLSVDSERFGGESGMFILGGILTSLTGVVIATVGPVVSLMRDRDRLLR